MTTEGAVAASAATTMGQMIIEALERHGERTAFIDCSGRISYREFTEHVARAVAGFEALGLRRNDVVAQLSGNRFEVYAVIAAAYISGLRSVTLHASASEEDHAFILRDSGARLLVADRPYIDRACSLSDALSEAAAILAHDEGSSLPGFWTMAGQHSTSRLESKGGPEDVIRLAYTGGTTGAPKGVMLSNRALVANTMMALAGLDWPDETRFLCAAPISHGAGSFILPTLWRGGCFILERGFEPGRFLRALADHQATMTFLVPTMIYSLLDHPELARTDISSLHSLIYGAAPIAPARAREAVQRFGPVLVQIYGQSEAPNTVLTMGRADHCSGGEERLRAAGRPFPGIQVKLVDQEGVEVPDNTPGELCVRGPLIMSGYWKRPMETADTLRDDWLHTGDVAVRDENGFYSLVDRQKDVIISGGFNVFPGEVEHVLADHPAVAAAAVIGVPDKRWGEAVKAIVVTQTNQSVQSDELIALVRLRKGPIHAPKTIEFVDALPLTALGKVDRRALRARYWHGAERSIN